MSKKHLLLWLIPVAAGVAWLVSPFRDSLPGREREAELPKVSIEEGGIVYCRMRADDFRFPLPLGARALRPVLESGGFDTVAGKVQVELEDANELVATGYANSLRNRLPAGGWVTANAVPGGLQIRFSYFGDR